MTETTDPGGAGAVRAGRLWPAAGAALFIGAGAVLWATGSTDVRLSADGGAPHPLWRILLPVALAMAAARLLPPVAPDGADRPIRAALRGRRTGAEAVALLACLAGFVAAGSGPGVLEVAYGLLYPVFKVVFLLAVPLLLLRLLDTGRDRGGPGLMAVAVRPRRPWQWAGLAAGAGYLWLAVFSPLARPGPSAEELPPLAFAVAGALPTLFTASVLEEVFFRVRLQTRLEALLGRWAGIALASAAYGVMHIVSHRAFGDLTHDLAAAVAVQGGMGLMLGYLWSRYRSAWTVIAVHAGINGLPMAALLAPG